MRGTDGNNTAQLNADKLRVFRHGLEYNNLDTRLIATDVCDKCEMRAVEITGWFETAEMNLIIFNRLILLNFFKWRQSFSRDYIYVTTSVRLLN